ncbi:unnamed protein product [Pleuronectes platessa]|uniref:Uncharacterized protein n=1 Tax=Pleuronectes platessa TaxID=8262 RepID=A0A9N7VM32_PLEPL|nr:unnamed protein product [Pleuronectes platessa]
MYSQRVPERHNDDYASISLTSSGLQRVFTTSRGPLHMQIQGSISKRAAQHMEDQGVSLETVRKFHRQERRQEDEKYKVRLGRIFGAWKIFHGFASARAIVSKFHSASLTLP